MPVKRRPFAVRPYVRRVAFEEVVNAAVAHVSLTQEGAALPRNEPSVAAAHALLAAVFDQCTPKTPLPEPKFASVRKRLEDGK